MTDQESLAEAERILMELEHETIERIESMNDSTTAPPHDGSIGRLTHIDAYQNQQMALHGRRQLEAQLSSIRAALARVKAGTYGLCVECGIAISPERLEYVPEAPYCVACKERLGR